MSKRLNDGVYYRRLLTNRMDLRVSPNAEQATGALYTFKDLRDIAREEGGFKEFVFNELTELNLPIGKTPVRYGLYPTYSKLRQQFNNVGN